MNTSNVKIEFSAVLNPDGSVNTDLTQLAFEDCLASVQAKLAVNYDVIAPLLVGYLSEPANRGIKNISVSALITVLWEILREEGKAPSPRKDPKGYQIALDHFDSVTKNYLRSEPEFFHLGEGRGASVVQFRMLPGEFKKDRDGNVILKDGLPLQHYRMAKEEWLLIEAGRAVAEAKKAAKAANKATGKKDSDDAPDSSAVISQPEKILDQAAE